MNCEKCKYYDNKFQYCNLHGEQISWDFICEDWEVENE